LAVRRKEEHLHKAVALRTSGRTVHRKAPFQYVSGGEQLGMRRISPDQTVSLFSFLR
jgi:hypothetical protein